VKRAFKYRFYLTDAQAAELSRTFGCVRKVYNMALTARSEAWALRGERTVTVSQDAAGRWFVSLLCEDSTVKALPATSTAVGVDAGLDHLLTCSTGEKIANPRHERRDRARLAKAQRACSRKQKGSANQAKARWYGRDVIVVDRWFPSSRLCSHCGARRDTMPLHIRTWTCECGTAHDRDVNAAKNLLAAGLAVTACGDGVRPQRNTPSGQPATKQEFLQREP
jgi:putative transposase